MVTPPSPSPLDPDAPEFPTWAANELATELDRLAAKLEEAKTARTGAERSLTEFEGGVAEQYREDLRRHVGHLDDTVEQFRRTSGQLRDAIREHEAALGRYWRQENPLAPRQPWE
jgi:chromosome segregation ATPase